MAIVDIPTGRIIGAKVGSLAYFHETAHLLYSRSDKGITLNYWQSVLHEFTITFILLSLISLFILNKSLFWVGYVYIATGVIGWLCYLLINLYEEIWCWKKAERLKKLLEEEQETFDE